MEIRTDLYLGDAKDILKEIMNVGNGTDRLWYILGVTYLALEEYTNAFDKLSKVTSSYSLYPQALYESAKIADISGALQLAVSLYEQALTYDRGLERIHRRLGDVYYELGRTREAYDIYLTAQLVDPGDEIVKARIKEIEQTRVEVVATREQERAVARRDVVLHGIEPIPFLEGAQRVRVLLERNTKEIRFQSGGIFHIIDTETGNTIVSGEPYVEWAIGISGDSFSIIRDGEVIGNQNTNSLTLTVEDSSCVVMMYDRAYGQGYFWAGQEDRKYRGSFEFIRSDVGFMIINNVSLEEYLASVIPSEMSAFWPVQALKAQAVAARSYTHIRLNPNAIYDLIGTVAHAAYKGLSGEHPRTTSVVIDTANEILVTPDGRIVDAVYSANNGGYIESSADVWGFTVPYLDSFPDIIGEGDDMNFPLSPYELVAWLTSSPQTFSAPGAYGSPTAYRWIKVLSGEELQGMIARHQDIGRIQAIIPQKRGSGGWVTEVIIKGENGDYVIRGDAIRSRLNVRSNRFFVHTKMGEDGFPAKFYIHGSGWGHGVGMSQTGAANMAVEGYTYSEILAHYYPGTQLIKR